MVVCKTATFDKVTDAKTNGAKTKSFSTIQRIRRELAELSINDVTIAVVNSFKLLGAWIFVSEVPDLCLY